MPGTSIRLDGDVSALLRRMRAYSELDRKNLNAALAESARESTLERFRRSKGPDGRRWKTSIRAAPVGGIKSYSDEKGFAVGTNVKHGATHQFGEPGRTIRAKTRKGLRFQVGGRWVTKKQVKVSIPARPFLGLSEEDMEEIKATVEDFIEGSE